MSYWSECPCGRNYITVNGSQYHWGNFCSRACGKSFRPWTKASEISRQNNKRARQHEKSIGGMVVPGSGNGPGLKGDVVEGGDLVECKVTKHKSYSMSRTEFEKGANSAALQGLGYRFEVRFESAAGNLDIVILPKQAYLKLKNETV